MVQRLQSESEEDEEKQWLIQHCRNPHIQEILKDTTVMMLHVLDTIGQFEPVNGVTISKKMGILKGLYPKMQKNYHQKIQAMHQLIEINFDQFLGKYDSTELQLITHPGYR